MAEKLTLEQLRRSAGLQTWELAQEAGVSTAFIQEAESRGSIPMALNKMNQVLEVLSKHHGRKIYVQDVKDLKVI